MCQCIQSEVYVKVFRVKHANVFRVLESTHQMRLSEQERQLAEQDEEERNVEEEEDEVDDDEILQVLVIMKVLRPRLLYGRAILSK